LAQPGQPGWYTFSSCSNGDATLSSSICRPLFSLLHRREAGEEQSRQCKSTHARTYYARSEERGRTEEIAMAWFFWVGDPAPAKAIPSRVTTSGMTGAKEF
jgi:hypothetical protein